MHRKEGEAMTQFLKCDSYLPPYMAYPKFLMKVDISETAKLVYMLLLDRSRLSMKNKDWQDDQGHVFVLYTILVFPLIVLNQI